MKKYFAILLFLTIGISVAHAQKKKADEYYASYNYKEAIALYLKEVASNPTDTSSLIRLANSYSIIKDYANAEIYYAKAAAMAGIPAIVYYNYAQILKNAGKIDEAHAQFEKYSTLMPSDTAGKSEVKYCDYLKTKFYIGYQVNLLPSINSEYSEFSPTLYNDSLVFVSDRAADMINLARNKYTGGNYWKIFVARPTLGGFGQAGNFSSQINGINLNYNEGPVSFTAGGKEIFYTEVAAVRQKHFVNRMKIYYREYTGKGWSERTAFPFNSDMYSVMHPAASANGKLLFFVSDMPGGYGGMDIYISHRTADGWSKPENLGSDINTPGDESFPFFRNDSVLFFSSTRHFNFGGMDIFSCKQINGKWGNVTNMGPDINSSTDDFGICFNPNNRTGYFSSNRKGGKGSDDIYSFFFIGDYMPLRGKVLSTFNPSNPIKGIDVWLEDEQGNIILTHKTDSSGFFVFDNLDPDKKYTVKINEDDPRLAGKKRIYLADKNNRIIAVTKTGNKNGKYIFTNLPADLTTMQGIYAPPSNLAGNLIRGDGSSKPLTNVVIGLVDTTGKVIDSTETNEFGSFLFNQVSPDGQYDFKVFIAPSKTPPCPKIYVTDREGNILREIYLTAQGNYKFRILSSDTSAIAKMNVDDSQLRFDMKDILLSDKKEPIPHVKVQLYDTDGKLVQTATTDSSGTFLFSNLMPYEVYSFGVDTSVAIFTGMKKIYLADSKHNIIRELSLNHFKFKFIPADNKNMGRIYVYDPWLAALNLKNGSKETNLAIIENIYFDYQKWDILPAAANTLTKVIQVMETDPYIKIELYAYTDPRGNDKFNIELSQKRADAAVSFMVQHGIDKKRVTGKGLGKSHPLNNCGDPNVHCTESEFALNRRIEFKITRNIIKK